MRCCDAAAGEYIFHHPLPRMVSFLLRKMERKPDWLSDFPVQIYCNRRRGVAAKPPQVTVSRPSDTRRWLSDRPRHPFGPLIFKLGRDPTLVGHGGSVSRRDHNQAYRRQKALSGGTNDEGATTSNASRSLGEGVWGRGASLREAASPPEFPLLVSSGGSAREGASLQRSPLPRIPRLPFA